MQEGRLMSGYPVMLNLTGKQAVVIGGGHIAHRKIISLLDAGAVVTVVSPDVIPVMQELVRQHDVTWLKKKYEPKDIENAMLVIAATNQKTVNRDIAEQAKDYQLVNVVDQPELGNFQVPAVLRRGKLTVTVSTGGASPILARKIRDDLSGIYDERYEAYLDFLWTCRKRIKVENLSAVRKKELLNRLLDPVYQNPQKQQEVLSDFPAF